MVLTVNVNDEYQFKQISRTCNLVVMATPPAIDDEIEVGGYDYESVPQKQDENEPLPYEISKNTNSNNENNRFQQRQGSTRRLIKVDYSVIQNINDDDDEDEEENYTECKSKANSDATSSRITNQNVMYRTAYDLATRCPSRKSVRRHTMVCTLPITQGSISVPQSRSVSRNSSTPTGGGEDSLSCTLPEMSWSRNSLQEELFESKQWREESLSLTLEEIVHIRSVLTKAELESLPVEGQVKEDVEKGKVCFLCLKTRFSIFGPWRQICKLCKRTVCGKCHSKMRIPTEHFSHVPVVALSPTMVSPVQTDCSMASAILSRLNGLDGDRGSVGSAPTSPKLSRMSLSPIQGAKIMSSSYHDSSSSEPQSLHNVSPAHSISEKRCLGNKSNYSNQSSPMRTSKMEKLKGTEMVVCADCKTMVIQIIKSSRINNRNNILHSLTLDLTPVY